MSKMKIKDLDDLRLRISQLKFESAEEEIYFDHKIAGYSKFIKSPFNFIKGTLSFFGLKKKKSPNDYDESEIHKSDWVTNLSRVALPFFLSKTILRGKGILIKTIISVLSQRVANPQNFNKDKLAVWIDKLTDWIETTPSIINKKTDYGIPEDSETY